MTRRYVDDPLWETLVEAVRGMSAYPHHRAYVMDNILPSDPLITAEDLSQRLGISRGESLVILHELRITARELDEEIAKPLPSDKTYSKICLGGTFTSIHYGHVSLLWTAFRVGERVIIGLTTDDFVEKMSKSHDVPVWDKRAEEVKETLSKHGWLDSAEIIKLTDPYGPSVSDQTIDAIVVSPLTAGRVSEINSLRLDRVLKPLEVIVCPLVLADDGRPVSSTRVSSGEISANGRVVKNTAGV